MEEEGKQSSRPDTTRGLSSNAIKALGERIVANELTFRGWLAVNTNSGEENSPNIDLIALKGEKRITIQVKTSGARSHKGQHFMGYYKEEGRYFNTKDGPSCDFVVAVYVYSPDSYSCLVLPVDDAEEVCRQHGKYWMNVPKKNGERRSPNFPVYLGKHRSSKYGLDITPFVDAWDLID